MTTSFSHGTGAGAAQAWVMYVAPIMGKAFDVAPGAYTVESVAKGLTDQHMRLWMVWDRDGNMTHAMVSEIRRRGDGRLVFHVNLASGEGMSEALREHWDAIVDWAQRQGCFVMVFSGRPGWRRSGLLPAPVTRYWEACEVPLEAHDA